MNDHWKMGQSLFFFLPPLTWVVVNICLIGLTPEKRIYLFPRFHALLAVYFCFIWVLCQRPGLVMLGQGIISIVGSLAVVAVACSAEVGVMGRVALTLSSYLACLTALLAMLQRWLPRKTTALLVFTVLVLAAMGDLLLLMLFPPALRYNDLVLTALLYLNPMVVISRCFPGYDFLRSPVFYPLMTTFLGPFRYPDLATAIAGFAGSGIWILRRDQDQAA